MAGTELKLSWRTFILGLLLTCLVAAADYAGYFTSIERWFYDRRARDCQFYPHEPTDRLIHLDIDDDAIENVGAWPWKRRVMAEVLDELHLAGPKAIALDVFFSERQEPHSERGPDGQSHEVDDDAELAAAMRRCGNVLVPVVFMPRTDESPLFRATVDLLAADLEQSPRDAAAVLENQGVKNAQEVTRQTKLFSDALRQAAYQRISVELNRGQPDLAELRRRLLPHTDPNLAGSPILRTLAGQYERALDARALRRFSRDLPPGLPPILPMTLELPTIHRLTDAAGSGGFVYYLHDADGKVRSMPLWVEHNGRMYPQLALALACAMMDVSAADITFSPGRMVLPRPAAAGGDLVVPVRAQHMPGSNFAAGLFADIPWFGPPEKWEFMYNARGQVESARHRSLRQVTQIPQARRRLEANIAACDDAIKAILSLVDADQLHKLEAHPLAAEDFTAREKLGRDVLDQVVQLKWMDAYANLTPQELAKLPTNEQVFVSSVRALPLLLAENQGLAGADVQTLRSTLKAEVSGKAVLIGWTATGAAADLVPTSLHSKCPGVVVHGVILNALLTDHFWRTAPIWVTLLITLGMGLTVSGISAALSPTRALAAALSLAVLYGLINGIVLFDRFGLLVGVAGPLLAVAAVWALCTMARFIVERAERARITRRFRSYVDPALVDFVLEHPEQFHFDGQVRELTVVFTDLAGFTTLSDRLAEGIIPILKEYLNLMVPLIKEGCDGRPGGYVNKFIGDGIMFFFGWPQSNDAHAADAVATQIRMRQTLDLFNERLAGRGLPTVRMRAGICTGPMVVGDIGPEQRADYTVLGNPVNLASRLESANKILGTHALVNDRTAELVTGAFLLRPVGRLRVVGKSQFVMTFEPLCPLGQATAAQQELVRRTTAMVDAFVAGDFSGCIQAADELETACESDGLAVLYRQRGYELVEHPPEQPWQGEIVLTEK